MGRQTNSKLEKSHKTIKNFEHENFGIPQRQSIAPVIKAIML